MSLSSLLFPNALPFDEIIAHTPSRPAGSVVTRIAPSPTGFLHLGAIFQALVNSLFAHQQGGEKGVFMIRIEDTDQERLIPEAMHLMINGLQTFGIQIDEGPLASDFGDVGAYGPYIQSHRKQIYHNAICKLIDEGKAYPCFMTAEELQTMRDEQQAHKLPTGVYGQYAKRRDASLEQVQEALNQQTPFVIRLKNQTKTGERIQFHDLIKGDIQMDAYLIDEVLIKKDGLPTYHFAHIIDDKLMGTTHVIRADERLASVPRHHLISTALGWEPFTYAHTSAILKLDQGNKRKLAKRKDPEADVRELLKGGYPTHAINEYLMTIIDSSFEDRKNQNPTLSYQDFPVQLSNMNQAGALFDRDKLKSMSNNYLSSLSHDAFYQEAIKRLQSYDEELYQQCLKNKDLAYKAINLERLGEKDPKRYITYTDLRKNIAFFFDSLFIQLQQQKETNQTSSISKEDEEKFISTYCQHLKLDISKEERFENLKQIAQSCNFALTNEEFKQGGKIGKVGDAAMILRIRLCGSTQTPDLYSVMQTMGIEKVVQRLKHN